jgi:hypothetical protein
VETDETKRRIASLRANVASGEHLDFEREIVPYVDNRIDAESKREVEAHLANCEVCRREVDELREFAAPRRRVRSGLIAALAAAAAIVIGFTLLMRPASIETAQPVKRAQTLAVALHDGDRIVGIDRNGAFRGTRIDAATAQRAASLLTHPDLTAPATMASLIGEPRNLRGPVPVAEEIMILAPVRIAVLDTRPEFIWASRSNAPYQITITADGSSELHGDSKTERWMPSFDLERGRTYAWQVSTMIGGRRVVAPSPPDPAALFRVVDQETADAIKSAKSHLIAGMLAYDAGAVSDARREFAELAAANPGSPIPQRLIASCDRAMAGTR